MSRWMGTGKVAGVVTLACLSAWACAQTAATPSVEVAGLQPDRRPERAPRITTFTPDASTVQRRLKGITQPWPGNVEQIAQQGAWYSPMFAPGMPGHYDLRGLHAAPTPPSPPR